jgi:hypothetical protein
MLHRKKVEQRRSREVEQELDDDDADGAEEQRYDTDDSEE